MNPSPESPQATPGAYLEPRIRTVGAQLASSLGLIVDSLPGGSKAGPQQLAEALGVDKVLTHRVLKAIRKEDPLSCIYHAPGPDPIRRFLRRAKQRGIDGALITRAQAAVSQFESLVRDELGNRSSLNAVLASFLPEARMEFEQRRKQSAYRAMSELYGNDCDTTLTTVVLHPSEDGVHLDIAWVMGSLGLRRLRPGVTVRFATKRSPLIDGEEPPMPLTIDRVRGTKGTDYRLDHLCAEAPAPVEILRSGPALHYVLGETGYGPSSMVDLILGEVSMAAMPKTVPVGSGRRGWFYGSTTIPAKTMLFDIHVHKDVYPGSDPDLLLYNSHENGIADVNDISRDIDRVDMIETVEFLGTGLEQLRTKVSPRQPQIAAELFKRLGWDPSEFRAWRSTIDYPVYGIQVVLAFDPPETPGGDRDAEDEVHKVWG